MAVYQNFLMYTGGIYDTTGTEDEIVGYHAGEIFRQRKIALKYLI